MPAHKAPPSRLASPRPWLVPETSHGRAIVLDADAGEGAVRGAMGSIPQSCRARVDLGRPFLVLRSGPQSAARAALGQARA